MNENSRIENQVYNAVAMIVDDRLVSANFDRTIAASIISCQDAKAGIYKVRYQDAIYEASANNVSVTYPNGARVYILIPEGDFLKPKKIIGLVENTTIEYDSTLVTNPYLPVGNSCAQMQQELAYSSYDKEATHKTLYKKGDNSSIITIDNEAIRQQLIEGATHLRFKVDIRTLIARTQKRGNFGLVATINLTNDRTKKVNLFVQDMSGDPYCSIDYITQYKDSAEIKADEFIDIAEIYYFTTNFNYNTDEAATLPLDIFLKNFQIYGVAHNSSPLFSNYMLDIKEKNNKDNNTITQDNQELNFIAELYQRLQPTITDNNAKYYWFRKNGVIAPPEEITATSHNPKYHEFAGNGWECLNSGTPVFDPITKLYYIEWNANSREFSVTNNDLKTHQGIYQCICDYNGQRTSKEFTVQNNLAPYEIRIKHENRDSLTLTSESDAITLEAELYQRDVNGAYTNKITNFNVEWSVFPDFELEGNISADMKYSPTLVVKGQDINLYNQYVCDVTYQGEYIGSQQIKINKEKQLQNSSIYIEITNDSQVFLYDEAGLSPVKNPLKAQVVLPLGFSVYKVEEGREVNITAEIDSNSIEWKIPKRNSLLQPVTQVLESSDDYYIIKNTGMLNFTIADIFSLNAVNNTITLKIVYNGQPIFATTNLQLMQEGTIGTNGTDLIALIEPIDKDNDTRFLSYPTIFYYTESNTAIFNKRAIKENILGKALLKVTLWDKGQEIENTSQKIESVKWSIKTPSSETTSFFTLDTTSRNCMIKQVNGIDEDNFYSVISCEIKYTNDTNKTQYIYAEYPLSWCFIFDEYKDNENDTNYQYQLDLTTGFNSVQYKEDGTSPTYNKDSTFEVQVLKETISNGIISLEQEPNSNYTFDWSSLNNSLIKDSTQAIFTPLSKYGGVVSNTGIRCIIYKNKVGVGVVYFPIYFYINKFAYAALNGWDGNGIKINENEENSYILTPQLGAGSKNDSNQFSGVVMGKLQHYNDEANAQHGLMGFNAGIQTFFLNSDNGILNARDAVIEGEITASKITILPDTEVNGLATSGDLSKYEEKLDSYVLKTTLEENYQDKTELANTLTPYTKAVEFSEKNDRIQISGANIIAGTVAAGTFIAGRGGNLYATGYDTFEHIQNNTSRICGLHSLASASVEIVSTEAYYGSKSLKIHSNGSTAHVWLGDSETDHKGKIPTTNGQKYIVSAYVKGSSSAVSGKMEAFSFATRNTIVNNSSFLGRVEFTVGGNWTRIYFPCIGDGNFLSLRFYNTTTGSDLYVDAIQIERAEEKNIEPSEFNPAATTVINGSHISAGSISASSIRTEEITALGKVTGGQFSLGNGNFIVDANGNLTAKDATLSGTIKVDDKSSVGTWNLHGGVNTGEVAYLYHSYRKDGSVVRTDDPLEDGGPYSGFVMNCNTRTDANGNVTYRNPTFFHIFAHHPGDSSKATIRLDHNGDARIGLRSNGTYTLRVNTGNTLNNFSQTDTPKRSEALTYGNMTDTEVRINGKIFFNGEPLHTSDRRLKENIVELQNSKYIQFFDNLNPVSFNMKDASNYIYRKHLGFIAQEVQEALEKSNLTEMDFSGLIQDHETGFYTLNYNHFIALNTAKIKQLEEVIKEQQKQIDELKSKLD